MSAAAAAEGLAWRPVGNGTVVAVGAGTVGAGAVVGGAVVVEVVVGGAVVVAAVVVALHPAAVAATDSAPSSDATRSLRLGAPVDPVIRPLWQTAVAYHGRVRPLAARVADRRRTPTSGPW